MLCVLLLSLLGRIIAKAYRSLSRHDFPAGLWMCGSICQERNECRARLGTQLEEDSKRESLTGRENARSLVLPQPD